MDQPPSRLGNPAGVAAGRPLAGPSNHPSRSISLYNAAASGSYGSSGFLSRMGGGTSTATSPSNSEPPIVNRFSRNYNRSESDLLQAAYPIGSGYGFPDYNRNPDAGILNRDPGRSAFQVYTVQHHQDRESPEVQIFGEGGVQYKCTASSSSTSCTDQVSSI